MSATVSSPNSSADAGANSGRPPDYNVTLPTGGNSSFVARKISVIIECPDAAAGTTAAQPATPLATGTPELGPNYTRTQLDDLRISAQITWAGARTTGRAQVRIFGVPQEMMNRLTLVVGRRQLDVKRNRIYIQAGDDVQGMSTVFFGEIVEAYGDYRSMPEVNLEVMAVSGYFEKFLAIPVTSASGAVSAAALIESIANKIGYSFVNHGVTAILRNPYYPGTGLDQIKDIAQHVDAEADLDTAKQQINIWPKGSTRADKQTFLAADSGMIGYPMISNRGIQVSAIFNQDFVCGALLIVKSAITNASGIWTITNVSHNIECQQPNGAWFSYIEAALPTSAPGRLTPGDP